MTAQWIIHSVRRKKWLKTMFKIPEDAHLIYLIFQLETLSKHSNG